MANAIANKYQIEQKGSKIEELKLSASQVQALKLLNITTVRRLYELYQADPRAVGKFLRLDPKHTMELGQAMGAIGGLMDDNQRDKLRQEEYATGLLAAPPELLIDTEGEIPSTYEAVILTGRDPVEPSLEGFDLIDLTPEIRHQGDRGTCVAFSVVRCREIIEHSLLKKKSDDLSEQYAYWHMKEIDGLHGVGSTLSAGAKTLVDKGVCLEKSFPYQKEKYPPTDNDHYQRGPKPPEQLDFDAQPHRSESFEKINPRDVNALKSCIKAGQPIAYGIPVFRSWKTSTETKLDGIITLPLGSGDAMTSGHAITLVGFGQDTSFSGGGYFIFDNSWGTGWAADGAFGPGRGLLPYLYVERHGIDAVVLHST